MTERAQRFESLYSQDIDPWNFRSSSYEHAKYSHTLASLPERRFKVCIEAGCSIGELSRLLSFRCDLVIGIDISSIAIREAIRRNDDRPNLSFIQGELLSAWPDLKADLIVLSEILYYLTPDEIGALAQRIAARCQDSHCLLVNYTGPTSERLAGPEAADCFIDALPGARHLTRLRPSHYQLDLLALP